MSKNNYTKVVVRGRIIGTHFFDDREPRKSRAACDMALAVAREERGKAAVFQWHPGMPGDIGSVMPCPDLFHDWKGNDFDNDATEHPGWTCSRCAMTCSAQDAEDDETVGRVPPHKRWEKFVGTIH